MIVFSCVVAAFVAFLSFLFGTWVGETGLAKSLVLRSGYCDRTPVELGASFYYVVPETEYNDTQRKLIRFQKAAHDIAESYAKGKDFDADKP